MYKERYRNQFHFSPLESWMNDPNGLVYYKGEYHLFYQSNPDDIRSGPMCWGHAVSKDLMHWEHLPIALAPDELGFIFSGSVVVDWKNTSGFGTKESPALVAIFTHHNAKRKALQVGDHEKQSLAYSVDSGRTWIKYAHNPVIPNANHHFDFRDPKVFWSEDYDSWYLILAVKDRVHIYSSKDLKSWIFRSEWGAEFGDRNGVWECPDLFKIKVADSDECKWVLLLSLDNGGPNGGSGMQYFVGDFDGISFIVDSEFANRIQNGEGVYLDFGPDAYAGVTWSDLSNTDGRRLLMSWMSNWSYAEEVPTFPWRSSMSLPKELTLFKISDQYQLRANAVNEIETISTDLVATIAPRIAKESQVLVEGLHSGLYSVQITFEKDPAATFGLKFYNDEEEMMVLGFDGQTNNYFIDRSKSGKIDFHETFPKMIFAPLQYEQSVIKWEVLIDAGAMEVIADDGQTNLSSIFFASKALTKISLVVADSQVELIAGKVTVLQSIWD